MTSSSTNVTKTTFVLKTSIEKVQNISSIVGFTPLFIEDESFPTFTTGTQTIKATALSLLNDSSLKGLNVQQIIKNKRLVCAQCKEDATMTFYFHQTWLNSIIVEKAFCIAINDGKGYGMHPEKKYDIKEISDDFYNTMVNTLFTKV